LFQIPKSSFPPSLRFFSGSPSQKKKKKKPETTFFPPIHQLLLSFEELIPHPTLPFPILSRTLLERTPPQVKVALPSLSFSRRFVPFALPFLK